MQVSIQWRRLNILTCRYEDDGEPVLVEAREMNRLLFVPFPSGWVKRFRKFASYDKPRTSAHETFNGGRQKYVVRWNPEHYSK